MNWRVSFHGVAPDMTPDPTPHIVFDRWFGADEAGARAAFETFDGKAILYTVDNSIGALGNKTVARK